MNVFLLLVQLFFVFYYGYVVFVFYNLQEISCLCEKLESFKQMKKFTFLWTTALVFFLYNMFFLYKQLTHTQNGGGNSLYWNALLVVSSGYALSFVFDCTLLNYFAMMEKKQCPCQRKHREYVSKLTIAKMTMNVLAYSFFLQVDKKKINRILEKKMKLKLK